MKNSRRNFLRYSAMAGSTAMIAPLQACTSNKNNGLPVTDYYSCRAKKGKFESKNGIIQVPLGAGLGVNIDPDYISTHKVFKI